MSADPAAQGWAQRPPNGFSGHIGPFWTRAEGDGWALGIVAGPQHANIHGMVHGGLLMTLLDNTLGMTVHHATRQAPAVTMQLNTHFLSAAHPGDFIEGRGEVLRMTRSVVFVRGVITVGDRQVAAADGIWKILGPAKG